MIPNQDIDAYRRVDPNAVPVPAERLMPPPATPRMPAATAERAPPAPAGAPPAPTATPSPAASATTAERVPSTAPPATAAPARPPEAKPAEATAQPKISDTGSPSAIASIIDGLGGAAATGGGYRIQVAAEKSEDGAKATWARLQKTNGDVLGPLRMQATRVDQGAAKGVWYRVQAGPLDERQAKDACAKLKARGQDCVVLPPSRG
ncbi:MAG: SPOR domain-containing protein [Rhodospirillales bacterium]|nr:MAG: SPOR domain-containing protein [Rhodospirillales bacterium]